MEPADAAELARRMREAVVHEMPRHRWVMPALGLGVVTIVVLLVVALVV